MKSANHLARFVGIVIVAGMAILLQPARSCATGEGQAFNFAVPFEQGAGRFQDGDGITITNVQCALDPKTTKGTNVYQIMGTYHLTSHYDGTLVAEVLSKDPTKSFGRLSRGQSMKLNGADGEFSLVMPVVAGGTPRISFYGQASSAVATNNGQPVIFDPLALPTRGDLFGSTSFTTDQFPENVTFETGAAAFANNDNITITSVRGYLSTIQPGGIYQIQGTYRLGSHETAEIAAYQAAETTTNISTQNIGNQNNVDHLVMGSGTFTLILNAKDKGFAHLAMLPQGGGENFASVYFGSGDISTRALPPPVDFPYSVQFAQGEGQLKTGDAITVTEARGTSSRFAKGNMYLLRGKFTLASQDKATLAAMVQADNPDDSKGQDRQTQFQAVTKGSGDFCLVLPMDFSGQPYISFRSATDPSKILGGCYLGNTRAADVAANATVMHLQVPMFNASGLFDGQLYLNGGLYDSMIVGGMSFATAEQNTTNYPPPPPPMPFQVPFKIVPSGTYFQPGDNITVDTVFGTENKIEPNNVYRVQGRYTLSTAVLAYLAVIPGYTDTQGDPHSGDIDPDEGAFEAQGSGTYSFILRMRHPGVPHVTFYPAIGGSSSSSISFTNAAPTTQPTTLPSASNEILEVDFTIPANVQRDTEPSQPNIQQPNVQQSNVSPPIAKRSTKGQH